jgi:hypothetical protein
MATLPDVNIDVISSHYSGDVSEFTNQFLQGKLDAAVDGINSRWGSIIEARLASGALPLRQYQEVVVRIASRVFSNEDGFKKENEGQYGYEVDAMVASGYLWYSDIDEKDLTGAVAPKKGGGPIGTATIGRHTPGWP